MAIRRNISITNKRVQQLLSESSNASRLIEEAVIFYAYVVEKGYLYDREQNRIDMQDLLVRGK